MNIQIINVEYWWKARIRDAQTAQTDKKEEKQQRDFTMARLDPKGNTSSTFLELSRTKPRREGGASVEPGITSAIPRRVKLDGIYTLPQQVSQ